ASLVESRSSAVKSAIKVPYPQRPISNVKIDRAMDGLMAARLARAGWSPDMRKMILSGAAALALAVVGCQQTPSKPATAQARPSALDVSAPAVSSTPSYQPAPVTPPTEPTTAQPVMAVSSGAGGNYK